MSLILVVGISDWTKNMIYRRMSQALSEKHKPLVWGDESPNNAKKAGIGALAPQLGGDESISTIKIPF